MRAKELLEKVGYSIEVDFEINDLIMDSRLVRNNDIFIALKGALFDGHDFIDEAIKKGAKLIIAEREVIGYPYVLIEDISKVMASLAYYFYGQPSDSLRFIGVTGTNGKTSCSSLIYQSLSLLKEPACLIGTDGLYYYPDGFVQLANTTPDALVLMKNLKKMKDLGIKTIIMEVSSHALALGRVQNIEFDIAIYTNLTQDHLDFHKDMEDYFLTKSLLFSNLKSEAYAVINADDSYGKRLIELNNGKALTYSVDNISDFKATNLKLDMYETTYNLDNKEIKTDLLSIANVYNSLSTYIVLKILGYDSDLIISLMSKLTPVAGRLDKVYNKDYLACVDYAHTPAGMENILEFLKKIKRNRVITVIGCGGDRDKSKRPIMGDIACRLSDVVIFTSDNPRTEKPEAILEDITTQLNYPNYCVIVDRRKAINKAISLAEKDDIITVLGKGHEDYQIIGTTKRPFSDKEEILKAVGEI